MRTRPPMERLFVFSVIVCLVFSTISVASASESASSEDVSDENIVAKILHDSGDILEGIIFRGKAVCDKNVQEYQEDDGSSDIDDDVAQSEVSDDSEDKPQESEVVSDDQDTVGDQEECVVQYSEDVQQYDSADKPQEISVVPGPSNFKSAGVLYDSNWRYTYYSSRVLYHYRTPEWSAGSDGIYRDSDGYVVVASSDLSEGSTFHSDIFGYCKVYDCGCPSGTIDVYVNF